MMLGQFLSTNPAAAISTGAQCIEAFNSERQAWAMAQMTPVEEEEISDISDSEDEGEEPEEEEEEGKDMHVDGEDQPNGDGEQVKRRRRFNIATPPPGAAQREVPPPGAGVALTPTPTATCTVLAGAEGQPAAGSPPGTVGDPSQLAALLAARAVPAAAS